MPSYFSWFLSPAGILVLGALDSSVAFFLPLANDTVVVYMAASHPRQFWLYPVLATIGSLIGSGTTYWIGRRIGQAGIERWVPKRRMEAARRKTGRSGMIALALPALIPPPFPFTPFVLASGALGVSPWRFLGFVGVGRLIRFVAEAVLARLYGRQLLVWMDSAVFRGVVWVFVGLAVVGTAWSIYALVTKTRTDGRLRGEPRPA